MQQCPPQLFVTLPKLRAGVSFSTWVNRSSDPKASTAELAALVESNPAHHHLAQSLDLFLVRLKKWEEELASQIDKKPDSGPVKKTIYTGNQLIDTVGKAQVRNALAMIALLSANGIRLPRSSKERASLKASETLKFAIQAEDFCEENRLARSDLAFLGGLHWDWLLHAHWQGKGPSKEITAAMETTWRDALKFALKAYELGSKVKSLKFSEYLFGSALLIPLGRAWMASLYAQGTKDLAAESQKLNERAILWAEFQEPIRFEVTHPELAALLAVSLEFFMPVQLALRYYLEPHFLTDDPSGLVGFARVLAAAHAEGIAANQRSTRHRAAIEAYGQLEKTK